MGYYLRTKHKNHANADGSMTDQQQRAYLQEFEAKLITPAEAALWKRGASNAGYHYLGCAKTFALMGRAFAEADLAILKNQGRR
jgi:alpha-galactosidase